MASSRQDSDPLQPVLRDAEEELSRRLQAACEVEAGGVADASANEIRELEDALLAAAAAAEHTLTLRRRLEQREAAVDGDNTPSAGATTGTDAAAPSETPDGSSGAVREFTDRHGRAWRAWPVTPGHSRTGRSKHFLGDFQLGWICFEGLRDSSRRRLAGHPPGWTQLSDGELGVLLERSVAAKERKATGAAPSEARPS